MAENIVITLDKIEALFAEPDGDPWNPSARYRSGIDEIFLKLRAVPIREPVSLTLQLLKQSTDESLEARTKQAIDRYCTAQIEANEDEMRAIKKEGRADFIISVVSVLVLFLAIAIIVYAFHLEGVLLSCSRFSRGWVLDRTSRVY